jgi:regulatory protein
VIPAWWKGRSTDRREPEEDSNSRNADIGEGTPEELRVLSLELKGAGGETVRVLLSDGSSFILHAETASLRGVRSGRDLTTGEIDSLKSESEIVFARHSALSLLSRAAHTRRGLAAKLSRRGYGAEAVKRAVDRMAELGYLDDRLFARQWAEARAASRKEGWMSMYKAMIAKGVPRAIAQEVVSEVLDEDTELEKALSLADGLTWKKAAAKLTARGFRSRTISRALRRLQGPEHGGE